MSLADFIEANLNSLVADWAEFAGQIGLEGSPLTDHELQDSARMMLTRITADMRTPQSEAARKAKSRGEGANPEGDVTDAAQIHADDRLAQGFKLNDLVAEFRALRATVLRRWAAQSAPSAAGFEEVIRFNESIDQTLSDSIRQYSMQVEAIRDRFAGVLAHDLRSPLGAIANSAEFLLQGDDVTASHMKAAANVQRSAARMKRMIDDLLDYTRTRLGDALPVTLAPQDIGRLCLFAADEVGAAYPQAQIDVVLTGDLAGAWDGDRISQLMANLLVNAIQHGSGHIRVAVEGRDQVVALSVCNEGGPIPKKALPTLFDPLTRTYSPPEKRGIAAGIGLGLYICRRIALAHGGQIDVTSSSKATTFSVTLPRT
jgi:signal transduction histidine kinase